MAVGAVANLRPYRMTEEVHVPQVSGAVFADRHVEQASNFAVLDGRQFSRSASPQPAAHGVVGVARVVPDAVEIGVRVAAKPVGDDGGVARGQTAVGVADDEDGNLLIGGDDESPQHRRHGRRVGGPQLGSQLLQPAYHAFRYRAIPTRRTRSHS